MEVTGVVLAGGKSRRLGRDKAVEPIDDRPLIGRVIDVLANVADESVVVVDEAERGRELPLPPSTQIVTDLYPCGGSLGGIFTGLTAARNEWAVVAACDMPFLNVRLLDHLLSQRSDSDAVVPVLDGRPEPTHAAYSKACLPHMERRLKAGDLKISGFFDDVRVAFVPQEAVESLDPDRLSFFNINTQQDLDRALGLVAEGR